MKKDDVVSDGGQNRRGFVLGRDCISIGDLKLSLVEQIRSANLIGVGRGIFGNSNERVIFGFHNSQNGICWNLALGAAGHEGRQRGLHS